MEKNEKCQLFDVFLYAAYIIIILMIIIVLKSILMNNRWRLSDEKNRRFFPSSSYFDDSIWTAHKPWDKSIDNVDYPMFSNEEKEGKLSWLINLSHSIISFQYAKSIYSSHLSIHWCLHLNKKDIRLDLFVTIETLVDC